MKKVFLIILALHPLRLGHLPLHEGGGGVGVLVENVHRFMLGSKTDTW
jgi:hypothetical protein